MGSITKAYKIDAPPGKKLLLAMSETESALLSNHEQSTRNLLA